MHQIKIKIVAFLPLHYALLQGELSRELSMLEVKSIRETLLFHYCWRNLYAAHALLVTANDLYVIPSLVEKPEGIQLPISLS